jgi:hypothetical protein
MIGEARRIEPLKPLLSVADRERGVNYTAGSQGFEGLIRGGVER